MSTLVVVALMCSIDAAACKASAVTRCIDGSICSGAKMYADAVCSLCDLKDVMLSISELMFSKLIMGQA